MVHILTLTAIIFLVGKVVKTGLELQVYSCSIDSAIVGIIVISEIYSQCNIFIWNPQLKITQIYCKNKFYFNQ